MEKLYFKKENDPDNVFAAEEYERQIKAVLKTNKAKFIDHIVEHGNLKSMMGGVLGARGAKYEIEGEGTISYKYYLIPSGPFMAEIELTGFKDNDLYKGLKSGLEALAVEPW